MRKRWSESLRSQRPLERNIHRLVKYRCGSCAPFLSIWRSGVSLKLHTDTTNKTFWTNSFKQSQNTIWATCLPHKQNDRCLAWGFFSPYANGVARPLRISQRKNPANAELRREKNARRAHNNGELWMNHRFTVHQKHETLRTFTSEMKTDGVWM